MPLKNWEVTRQTYSFLGLHPHDAYLYVLHLLGKKDTSLRFPDDATCIFYATSSLAEPLRPAMQTMVERAQTCRVKKVVCDLHQASDAASSEFPDILFCASFENAVDCAKRYFDSVAALVSRFPGVWVLGRNAFACVQLLGPFAGLPITKSERLEDHCLATARLEEVALS